MFFAGYKPDAGTIFIVRGEEDDTEKVRYLVRSHEILLNNILGLFEKICCNADRKHG